MYNTFKKRDLLSIPHQKELCRHSSHDRFCDSPCYNDPVLVQYSIQLLLAFPMVMVACPLYTKQIKCNEIRTTKTKILIFMV